MAGTEISPEIRKQIMLFQRTEITEYNIYQRLARRMEGKNREVLERISLDEKRHAGVWRRYT
ncbi:MAG: rubrerythrin family protein, partial [Thermovirgaceae bacterium]|nr:rubrerythrin family protein [Synergistaceae bacterium]